MRPSQQGSTIERTARPSNLVRLMPTLSFSLMPHQIEAIRDAAIRLQVSQSHVVRAALDQFFPGYSSQSTDEDEPPVQRNRVASPGIAQLVRELAGLRRELTELRQHLAHVDSNPGQTRPADLSSDPPTERPTVQ
jgi:hypothetical protein